MTWMLILFLGFTPEQVMAFPSLDYETCQTQARAWNATNNNYWERKAVCVTKVGWDAREYISTEVEYPAPPPCPDCPVCGNDSMTECQRGDFNGDGVVTIIDLEVFTGLMNQRCEVAP